MGLGSNKPIDEALGRQSRFVRCFTKRPVAPDGPDGAEMVKITQADDVGTYCISASRTSTPNSHLARIIELQPSLSFVLLER